MAAPVKRPRPESWAPPVYDDAEIAAIKRLAADDSHALALRVIVEVIAGTYDQPFRPGGEAGQRATDFACGRMFVGQQIVKLMKLRLADPGKPTEQGF